MSSWATIVAPAPIVVSPESDLSWALKALREMSAIASCHVIPEPRVVLEDDCSTLILLYFYL